MNSEKSRTVKILDASNKFYGTGFFIRQDYCVTCHHNICYIENIKIGTDKKVVTADWIEEYSDMEKDIAILRTEDTEAESLIYALETEGGTNVKTQGYPFNEVDNFPQGKEIEGLISGSSFLFEWEGETISGNSLWNRKPKVSVNVFRFVGDFEKGYSGAPVFSRTTDKVVGMFAAKDDAAGYVIPVETILGKMNLFYANPAISLQHTNELIWRGNENALQGKYAQAIDYYDKVIKHPNFVYAWHNKGQALFHLGRYLEAIECYDKALEINNKFTPALDDKALAHVQLGNFDKAIKFLEQAIKINKYDGYAYVIMGKAYCSIQWFDKAIECYNKAIDIDKSYTKAMYSKGLLFDDFFKDQAHQKEAIECYDDVLQLSPKDTRAWYRKGLIHDEVLKEYNEAIECYSKVLKYNPDHAGAWYNRAGAKYKKLKKDKSEKDITSNAETEIIDSVLSDLSNAIDLDKKYVKLAKQDNDFENLKENEKFKKLIDRWHGFEPAMNGLKNSQDPKE
jgi:tetratricopeptide (TPR) repeat protein